MRLISTLRPGLLLMAVFWSATAMATPGMNDFAYGLRIASSAENTLVKLVLPDTVYRQLARADGGDIRVFRLDGKMVSHFLRPHVSEGKVANLEPLTFFPLSSQPAAAGHDLRTRPDAPGAVLNPASPAVTDTDQAAPAYLIDIRQLDHGLESLLLSWRRHRPDVLVKARVEGSNDQVRWYPLLDSVTLADIRQGDRRLQKRAIRFRPHRAGMAYVRLTWLSGGAAITIEKIEGVALPVAQPPARRWIRADYRTDVEASGSMQFDSGGSFAVDRIDLEFSPGDGLVTGTVKSRPSEQAVWQIRYQGTFYHLAMEDATLRNDPVMVPGNNDRYWKLDIDSPRSDLGRSVPRLMLGGRPHALFFLTEEAGVYLLTFGSRRVAPLDPPPDLVQRVKTLGARAPKADIGGRIVLGGSSRLRGPASHVSGRMLSLSSMLLGCVLLIAFLAWWAVRRLLA